MSSRPQSQPGEGGCDPIAEERQSTIESAASHIVVSGSARPRRAFVVRRKAGCIQVADAESESLFLVEIDYCEFTVDHISENNLEGYVMRTLPEADLKRSDERLLTCWACRNRLRAMEEYVTAMREPRSGSAIKRLEVVPKAVRRPPYVRGVDFGKPRCYLTAIVTGGLVWPATLITTGTFEPGVTPDGTTTLI